MSTAFLLTTLVVVATPGTGAIFTINAGIGRGSRAGVIAALGCTLGVLPHLAAAITGLAGVVSRSPATFQVLKWAGVAYLLFLAWQTARERGAIDIDATPDALSSMRVIRSAVLINLLNPKLTIFFFAFLPQFVPSARPDATSRMLVLSAVFMLVTFVVFAVYGLFAAAVRDRLLSRPAVMNWTRRCFAGTYVALAGRLALQAR